MESERCSLGKEASGPAATECGHLHNHFPGSPFQDAFLQLCIGLSTSTLGRIRSMSVDCLSTVVDCDFLFFPSLFSMHFAFIS